MTNTKHNVYVETAALPGFVLVSPFVFLAGLFLLLVILLALLGLLLG